MTGTAHGLDSEPGQRVRLATALQGLDADLRALESSVSARLDSDAEREQGDEATIRELRLQLAEERRLRMEAARQIDRAARTLDKICNG